jgi:hypothetical protein
LRKRAAAAGGAQLKISRALAALSRGRRSSPGATLEPSDALWLLSNLCAVNQKTYDPESLARECVPPLDLGQVAKIAERLGFDARTLEVRVEDLSGMPGPIATELAPETADAPRREWAIVL